MAEVGLVPQQITELRAVPAEDINKLADAVLETAHAVNVTNEALEDFSENLRELKRAKDKYDSLAPKVKDQIRKLSARL